MTTQVMQWNRHFPHLVAFFGGAAVPWIECYLLIGR
ncbi:Uncharacterized membrane protein ArfB (fragment) (plasmid) [Cupriavidus taiwanensis]|uniref:Uncharacterized membrane protein ArfB n=1 Tax=Cupriavidus taiwanensis TaxID=164546 RepID=A0A9Q7V1W1_9BURK